jgi:general secretion pathway protein G
MSMSIEVARPILVVDGGVPPENPVATAEDALFQSVLDASGIRRRYEFFLWTQTQLQAILPHGLLICGLPRPQSARMVFDYYYGVPYEPESIARLCDPVDGMANRMVDRWIGEGFEPLLIHAGAAHDAEVRLAKELGSLGFGDTIVHGIPKAQATASAHGIFAFVSLASSPGARERRIAQLVVPQIFGAYCRALTRDRPLAMAQAGDTPLVQRDAPITEREAEILRWIRDGKSNLEIGMILSISPLTVKNHVQKILRKLNASNRAQAVSKAISMQLLTASAMRRSTAGTGEGGFTLLEVLVVLVIIGLLAGIVAPKFFSQVGKSEVRVARAQIDALGKALDQYRLDVGRYPSSSQGLVALSRQPDGEPRWAGPYLSKSLPQDPWGQPYVYKASETASDFELLSYGKDGRPGGEGDAQDVVLPQ